MAERAREDHANPYPDWPDVLTLADGRPVTTAQAWWQTRRPQIFEDFEREVYGRVPREVPSASTDARAGSLRPQPASVGQ